MSSKRNFACPKYDFCLAKAAERKLGDFKCLGCVLEYEVRPDWPEIQESDSRRIMTLFVAICRNRIRPRPEPLTADELAFLWEEADGSEQAGAAGAME